MDVSASIIVTADTKDKAKELLEKNLTGVEYTVEEKEVTFTELKVTLKLDTRKAISHLFKLVKAPDEEIKYLSKIPSVIKATASDVIQTIFKGIQ